MKIDPNRWSYDYRCTLDCHDVEDMAFLKTLREKAREHNKQVRKRIANYGWEAYMYGNPHYMLQNIDVKPRLGRNNPNAYKYSTAVRGYSYGSHQYIRIGDAERVDIYLRLYRD